MPDEISGYLLEHKNINLKKLQERYDHCVLKIRSNGTVDVQSGRSAKKIIDRFLSEQNKLVKKAELTGRTANPGLARGLARIIIDARQCDTFRHGEILVAPMTSPDYILAARRAAAIVTDEGGVTCHAAIISRELGVPCVIATKNATKILRDGDLIEVDANSGNIKILEK